MTLEGFRIKHSTLIEHYQYIEMHLEGIYAALSGKDFTDGLHDVEKDAISRLLHLIKSIDLECTVLTKDDYDKLTVIVARRNFYVHNCYIDMVFDRKTNAPSDRYRKQILDDTRDAEQMREYLFNKKMGVMVFLPKEKL